MSQLIQQTHYKDCLRSFLYGILEAGWQTFAFVVAIRYFQADTNFKSLIAAAGPIGFLITPLSLYFFARKKIFASSAASLIYCLTALFLLASVSVNSLLIFGTFVILSLIINVQKGPAKIRVRSITLIPESAIYRNLYCLWINLLQSPHPT